jgi:hypothetical protein
MVPLISAKYDVDMGHAASPRTMDGGHSPNNAKLFITFLGRAHAVFLNYQIAATIAIAAAPPTTQLA